MHFARIGARALPVRLKPARVVATSARRQPSFFDDDPFFSSASSLFDELDREVADLGSRIASSSEALPPAPVRRREGESEQQTTTLLPGGKGYARTRSSSGRTATSSWSSSESVVVWGVEPPTTAAAPTQQQTPSFFFYSPLGQLAGAALLLYAAVAARFARRTLDGETKYKTAARWRLAALWPALAALSPGFRQELREALALEKRGTRKGAAEEEEKAKKEAGGSGVALFASPEGERNGGADNASPFDER